MTTKARGPRWKRGYVHVYTGNGKGKTTAALGLALRAAGAGLNVFIAQFLKGRDSSELKAMRRLSHRITVKQLGRPGFISTPPSEEDGAAARRGLEEVKEILRSGHFGVIVLDEANVAVSLGLFPAERLLELIDAKPAAVELIITGRKADRRVLAKADLVTEMRERKHYYRRGVAARKGIEN